MISLTGTWRHRPNVRRRMRRLLPLTWLVCTLASAGAWAQHDAEPEAPPDSIVHVTAGQVAPFSGELVTSAGLATILAEADDLERRLRIALEARAKDQALAEEQRLHEVGLVQDALDDQHKLSMELIQRLNRPPPFWEDPFFAFNAGVLVGALVAMGSYKLGTELGL